MWYNGNDGIGPIFGNEMDAQCAIGPVKEWFSMKNHHWSRKWFNATHVEAISLWLVGEDGLILPQGSLPVGRYTHMPE